MKLTKSEAKCIRDACVLYKELVDRKGPDGTPGLNSKYDVEDFYKVVVDNIDEFRKDILEHPFFSELNVKDICEVSEQSHTLFMYCFQTFIDKKLGRDITTVDLSTSDITSIGIGTITDTTDATINMEKENKKEFIKEVLNSIPRKKSLKEFFDDMKSYKQYRDDVDQALFYMNWEKIHRIMKKLKWVWFKWVDEYGEIHKNTVPSVYGIRENVIEKIKDMEEWINEHPDADDYIMSSCGFQVEMYMCNVIDDPDDYTHQIRFKIQFVVEEYDNGM